MPLHSVTVADPGKGLGGPPPSLFFTKLRLDGPKKNCGRRPRAPFYSRVWMTSPLPLSGSAMVIISPLIESKVKMPPELYIFSLKSDNYVILY